MVATPMYGGMCCSEFAQNIYELRAAIDQTGNHVTTVFLGNESLVTRARNSLAWYFLSTDATHLLFMDADLRFRPRDVMSMLRADKDIIAGIAPVKAINWDAVRSGAQKNVKDLSRLTGYFNMDKLEGHDMRSLDMPFQVKHIGSGCMMIKRGVFEKLKDHVEYYTNGTATIAAGEKIYNFFRSEVVDKSLLSEDYYFCHLWRQHGGTVWAAPWCEIGHFGSYLFSGQYLPEIYK